MMPEVVEVLVDGGKASAGPPLGPALGPKGVNIMQVVSAINEKTRDFAGMKVPVKVIIDPKTRSFEIEVGTPPATALIKGELKLKSGSGSAAATKVGDLSIETAMKIVRMKGDALMGTGMKEKVKEIVGTCVSMGITVDGGKDPRVVQKAIDAGEYDGKF
ncbi:MAG: 50S ribosomal protein L11 [Thermoplasmata archaeon HGW-Thermoplasmata-1]|nr:MAG: 50S ribosomal protein L11 [Thermoplasmata archaeon HGW-Thermoplasmata-1]